jgi:N-acetylmuramoyl-L-alanine amidase
LWIFIFGGLEAKTIVLDPGHGGVDGGCKWNGLLEKKLNLDVCIRVRDILKAKGHKVVMTRASDQYVSLEKRVSLANQYGRRSVFVSIHFNAHRDRSINGMEVFYSSSRGSVLAKFILASMDSGIKGKNRGIESKGFYVLLNTVMPAVLIECAFTSNKVEAARYAVVSNRQLLANSIARGIMKSSI